MRGALNTFLSDVAKVNSKTGSLNAVEGRSVKTNVKMLYDHLASNSNNVDVWNWGLSDPAVEGELAARLPGFNRHFSDGYSEQLYYYLISRIPNLEVKGLRVLEIGCGLGRGADFLARLFPMSEYVGLDLSERAVEAAQARFGRPGVRFVTGDAENLPFEDNSFDVVLNVESAHNYPNLSQFLDEVTRVLAPAGWFALIDLFTAQRAALFEEVRHLSGLKWAIDEDVSAKVRAAIASRVRGDSFVRSTWRKRRRTLLEQMFGESFLMLVFGAQFIGHRFDFPVNQLIKSGRIPVLDVEAYRLAIAQK